MYKRSTSSNAVFFARNPVFTATEFAAAAPERGKRGNESLLAHHVAAGRLLRIRRGLYAVVPPGVAPDKYIVDPYLVASKAAGDAIIAYHSALAFHGLAYTVMQKITFLTTHEDSRAFSFQGVQYQPVQHPRSLLERKAQNSFVEWHDSPGQDVAVISIERTVVDCLDRIEISGGIEEVWRSLASISYLKFDDLMNYLMLLDNATTTAKLGFFLEQHQEHFMITPEKLDMLAKHKPRSPRYMFRTKREGKLISRWNLIVPESVLNREWEEII